MMDTTDRAAAPLDVLVISQRALWPLDQGYRVHGYHMVRAMAQLGIRIGVASLEPLPADADAALTDLTVPWPTLSTADDVDDFAHGLAGPAGRLRARLARYLVDDMPHLAAAVQLVRRHQPAVVIGVGIHAPVLLAGLRGAAVPCVWYAGDELVNFDLSCLRHDRVTDMPARLRNLAVHAALERLFVPRLHGAIGVSRREARWLRFVAGARRTLDVANGVDVDYFQPQTTDSAVRPHSLVFWGRMDFEPNIDAVRWFADRVWPRLLAQFPDAHWSIVGKNPHASVSALAQLPGLDVLGSVPDVRPHALAAAVTILPMRCGGGIKNKLLEAAALGRPIVASRRATGGLHFDDDAPLPLAVCRTATQWVTAIGRLWREPAEATRLSRLAYAWVRRQHTWSAAAQRLWSWLETIPEVQERLLQRRLPELMRRRAA